MKNVLIIDNYDSFTYNLFQYIGEITGKEPAVIRNNEVDFKGIKKLDPLCIIISPGPGHPSIRRDRGNCTAICREFYQTVPLLGICMGHQILAYSFGASIVKASVIMHGKCSDVMHTDDEIFHGLPEKIRVMRYHSLIVEKESLPKNFDIIARTDDDLIMGIRMRGFPAYGLQFHPESIGTGYGKTILHNFLRVCDDGAS
jgi:anthranilate synthase/aminodeoxychorismate synthase-like glutamine amidotransferase